MKGLIITNQEIGHNEYKIKRFFEESESLDIKLKHYVNDGTLAYIDDGHVVVNIEEADFVIYLDKDLYLAKLLEKAGYRVFNKSDFIRTCDDKMLTYIACLEKDIPMIKTFAGPLVYSSIETPRKQFLDKVINEIGFPMVVKKVYGSLGLGVYLVNNKEELYDLYNEICHAPVIFQKYIKSSISSSIRVIIIDRKPIGAFRRINKDDFRSNFGETAGSEKIENMEKYLSFAKNIAEKLDIEYAGIDLLDNEDGDIILCEINSNAFFEEFEKTTNINVAKLYLEMVVRKVYYEQK